MGVDMCRLLFMSGRSDPSGPTLYEMAIDEGSDMVAPLRRVINRLVNHSSKDFAPKIIP